MEKNGQLLGTYRSAAIPFWVEWGVRIPFLGTRFAKRAVSEIRVLEQGIVLQSSAGSRTLTYKEVRRVWFERFQTGSEQVGHTAFRIDIIAENLDTLFSLTKTDCASDDADLRLMETLYQRWKAENWKHYHVVAAVVQLPAALAGRADLPDAQLPVYLCMQKARTRYDYTSYRWEFPGGKVEGGETEAEALQRELREEMDYEVAVGQHLTTVEHQYRDFGITLSCYLCTAVTADFVRKEHQDHRWLTVEEMRQLDWCAADAPVLDLLLSVDNKTNHHL